MNEQLTDREVRVLGSLVEKDLSTPEYYPMTLSALTTACNQKSNRDPVVSYGESDVTEAIESLQRKRMVGSSTSSHGRVTRYRHALVETLKLDRPQLAILASLMLRGPETPGELRGRASRMHEFGALEEVDEVLEGLMSMDPSLAVRLPRRSGQKEARYAHLFAGMPEISAESEEIGPASGLEQRVAGLEKKVEELAASFVEFRKQFE